MLFGNIDIHTEPKGEIIILIVIVTITTEIEIAVELKIRDWSLFFSSKIFHSNLKIC